MELGLILKNVIIVGAIGGVVFASQIPAFRPAASKAYSNGVKSENSFAQKAQDWLKTNIYPKLGGVSGEVAKTQVSAQQQLSTQQNNLKQNALDSTKIFLAKEILSVLNVTPQELGSCKAPN